MPNDGEEQDRQDFQHALVSIVLDNRLACAPIVSPRHVLDIGTGTGIWAIEFAEQNPDSFVVGTDLRCVYIPFQPILCGTEQTIAKSLSIALFSHIRESRTVNSYSRTPRLRTGSSHISSIIFICGVLGRALTALALFCKGHITIQAQGAGSKLLMAYGNSIALMIVLAVPP